MVIILKRSSVSASLVIRLNLPAEISTFDIVYIISFNDLILI